LGTEITEGDFLNNDHDVLDQKFNYVEYPLVLALLEIYKRPVLLASLVQQTNSTKAKCYNLYTFSDEHPELNDIINAIFSNRLSDFPVNGNWKSYLETNYRYDVNYVPYVRIINTRTVDLSKEKYIVAPYEINEEKFTNFDNNYPMWTNSSDLTRITTLPESQFSAIDNLMLTINNGFVGDENIDIIGKMAPMEDQGEGSGGGGTGGGTGGGGTGGGTGGLHKCSFTRHVHESVSHIQFALDERFESSGKSEYTVLYVACASYNLNRPVSTRWNILTPTSLFANSKCMKVFKDDVNNHTVINWAFDMFSPDMFSGDECFDIDNMPTGVSNSFGFGAYECDGIRSNKALFSYTKSSGTDNGYGRRKYTHDTYFFDPTNNSSYPFGVRHPGHHTSFIHNGDGYLKTHRWE
jgi:uncharacterized membrane protein YgcG